MKEVLNYRQAIDYDRRYKLTKFEHHNFPYRSHIYLKQQLYEQRAANMEKRKKIREVEENIKTLERTVADKKK